tara:strand:- start:470 stop:709 length:240 start_codon:yes stop_codon:yes gene_type:complete
MNNLLIISLITSSIYIFIKFIHIKFILKSDTLFNNIPKETIFVFLASFIGNILIEKFNINKIIGGEKESPGVFTSVPDF